MILNKDDGWAPSSASDRYDPFVQWAWMGPSVSSTSYRLFLVHQNDGFADNTCLDGVLAWTAMGVNLTDSNIRQPPDRKRAVVNDHLEH